MIPILFYLVCHNQLLTRMEQRVLTYCFDRMATGEGNALMGMSEEDFELVHRAHEFYIECFGLNIWKEDCERSLCDVQRPLTGADTGDGS